MDHLLLYRQRFLREHIPVTADTRRMGGAGNGPAGDSLQSLAADTKTEGYLQADEAPVKVLESRKKNFCHQGYYWVYHNPINQSVLFDYQPTRGAPGPKRILD